MNVLSDISQLILASATPIADAAGAEHAAHAAHESVRLLPQAHGLLWLIPALPLIGFVINALAGAWLQRRVGKKANHTIAIGAMVGA